MRRRRESTAHVIAAEQQRSTTGTALRRIKAPEGAIATMIQIDTDPRKRGSVRGPALTAAAQVLTADVTKRQIRIPAQSWHKEVWDLRRVTGELRFIGDRQANAVSQVRMFIGEKPKPDDQPTPVTKGPVADLSNELFGNVAATQQQMKRAAQHLGNNGETELVVSQDDAGHQSWSAWSTRELSGSSSSGWKINDGVSSRTLGRDEIPIRCWTPDPEFFQHSDCPARAIIPVARELEALTKYVSAQTDSRLAGAGLLIVPTGIQPLAGQFGDDDDVSFGKALSDMMLIPITDRGSAASVVPLIAEVDAENIDKIRHIRFDTVLDPKAHELRDEAIRRIALGMDSDPSVLLGLSSGNHWSAWAVDENEVRLVVAPLAATICHALTVGWLTPVLELMGIDNPDNFQVWFDTTPLELRPDRSKDAQSLHDKGQLSNASLLRENGFSDDDAPSDEEAERALLIDLIKGGAASDLVALLLPKLGIDIDASVLNKAAEIKETVDGDSGDNSNTGTTPASDSAPDTDRSLPSTKDTPPPAVDPSTEARP